MTRSMLCRVVLLTAVAILPAASAQAQEWPAREIRVFSGFPAGSGADTLARYFSEKLRPYVKQPMVVENKPGALGSLAGEAVARARPDGYTMLIAGYPAMSVNLLLLKKIGYDPVNDYAPVSTLLGQPFILVVDPKLTARTVSDLSAYLRAKGEKASYAGTASSSVVLAELYKTFGGVPGVQVMYRDAQAYMGDMLNGAIDFAWADPVFGMGQVNAGRLRALAVSTPRRSPALPDVPTMAEAGLPQATFTSWWAAVMPAGSPPTVVRRLNGWFQEILATEETKKFLASFGAEPLFGTPEDLRKLQVDEIERWRDYVRIAKIEPQ
jgi:tripartite-type tricarboxylate transporter receptor subunit TctC